MTAKPEPNRILATLRGGKVPLGMEINTGNPSLIEILAYTGFDFCMLDMEHARVNPENMEHCIRAGEASGITVIVRVTENNPSLIRQAKEAGAQGVVIPHIETAQDARKAVESLRFPPDGKCGFGPSRAEMYGAFKEYKQYSNDNTMLVPLLEDQNGIDNAEEILAELKPGVDAIGVGQGDLRASLLTKSGEIIDETYVPKAFAKVLALSKKAGIPMMNMALTPEALKPNIEQGVKILLGSIDWVVFYRACQDFVRAMKS
jgi:2-dehydro-3-deoxyglucarate aldolase